MKKFLGMLWYRVRTNAKTVATTIVAQWQFLFLVAGIVSLGVGGNQMHRGLGYSFVGVVLLLHIRPLSKWWSR